MRFDFETTFNFEGKKYVTGIDVLGVQANNIQVIRLPEPDGRLLGAILNISEDGCSFVVEKLTPTDKDGIASAMLVLQRGVTYNDTREITR